MRKTIPFEYAVRNLRRAPVRGVLGLFGSILVVLLVLASSAFVTGMQQSMQVTGSDRNVILLGSGSEESIERSQIPMRTASIAAASLAGIRERLGEQYVSPEVHLALAIKAHPDDAHGTLTVVRGVRPAAFLVHPQVRVVAGRAPEPGRDEIMVGDLVASKLGVSSAALSPGSVLSIDGRPWNISGRFEAPRTVMDAEIWMPLSDLQVISQRDSLSCVIVGLDDSGRTEFPDVQAFAVQRLDLEITSMKESEYYHKLSEFFGPIRLMVLATAALVALGGVLGGLNTMFAAFAARIRELGTLQVLGYSRLSVVYSMIQESVLITSAGALVACFLALSFMDGLAVRFSMGAFGLIVNTPVLCIGILSGLALGIIGALPPAFRCLRLPVNDALKS